MSKKLTNKNKSKHKKSLLTRIQDLPFRIAICGKLENKFDFKRLNKSSIKEFHNFINSTVGENLSITEVDNLYLRTKGKVKEKNFIHGEDREIFHYGKDRKAFRVFGYYNQHGYFTIVRIDPKHKTHS